MRARLASPVPILIAMSLLGACSCLDVPEAVEPAAEEPAIDRTIGLPPCEGGVLSAFTAEAVAPPEGGSAGYLAPSLDALEAIDASFDALMIAEAGTAIAMAAAASYEVCAGEGEDAGLVLFRPAHTGTGRPLWALRPDGAGGVVVEVADPWSTDGPLDDATAYFRAASGRALIAAGSHPCANAGGGCPSAASICGGDVAPDSEAARAELSLFQLAHERISEEWADAVLVSIAALPSLGIAVSAGGREPWGAGWAASEIAWALRGRFPTEALTVCGGAVGLDVADRACFADSVQARHAAGLGSGCGGDGPGSARFVHVSREGRLGGDTFVAALLSVR